MKKRILVIVFLLMGALAFSQSIKKVKIDDVVKLLDTASGPIVVNFWASWCAPCVHEIPWFEKNISTYKNIKLILVSLDFQEDYPKNIAAFVKQNGYTSTIYWLNETDANYFCKKIDKSWGGNIPATIMVNNKKQYKKFYGQQLPEPQLQLALQQLVE
jgi:thiol-disulfide isomerase/thioredoxin